MLLLCIVFAGREIGIFTKSMECCMAKNILSTYKKRRNFSVSPEPAATIRQELKNEPLFVIQKHAASHLHFDVRLEIGGVLASWAVPKGISTDPAIKHLAVPTEDHPYDYAFFEGTIPQGQYGGGTVMVWDIGTYTNIKEKNGKAVSMQQSYKMGTVEVALHGKKLHGNYALIRIGKQADNRWILLKMNDEYAHKKIKNVTKSALTGRTMAQIARGETPAPKKKRQSKG